MKRLGRPRIDEAIEAMLMIEPRPFLSIPGMKARDTRYMDFTLTANPRSQSFGVASRRLPCCTIPAQLNRTSTSPTSRATPSIATSSVTSSTRVWIRSSCKEERACLLTSVAQPCAPSRAKASAAPRPIPCAAAVTNATLPARRPAMRAAIILPARRGVAHPRRALLRCGTVNQLDFKGRTAIVTGGKQGIGEAIVKRLEASGAKVRVWDLAGAPKVDVADASSVKKAAENALQELGKIDVLVNNAGIAGLNTPTVDYPIEEWERVLRINLTSQFLCCRALAPHMVKAGYGRIVNIASVAGKEGNPNAVAYSASKAGVIALTKSLGKELAQTGVLVNCVTPAAAKTAIFEQMTEEHISYMLSKIPMNRFVNVDEVAALVCWLASEDCSFSTGAVFDISGGRATY